MRLHHGFVGALVGLSAFAGAGAVRAEGGETLPLAIAQRPLTLPRLTLAPTLGFSVDHLTVGTEQLGKLTSLAVSARFGLLDDLEIDAVVLPLTLAPSVVYASPRFEATFRMLKGDVEIGARLATTFVRQEQAHGVAIETGVPVLIHLGAMGRIDMGVYVPMDFKTGPSLGDLYTGQTTAIGLRFPIQLLYNVDPTFYFAARTGVGTDHVSSADKDLDVPLGVLAGYAVASAKHAFIDVNGYLTFPILVRGDTINPGVFQTGLSATMYLYF